jgi:uncharacterized protein GlcG (DUF336 family)
MSHAVIELLEDRRLLSSYAFDDTAGVAGAQGQSAVPANLNKRAALKPDQVESILAAAASQAKPTQGIVVVDREGFILGIFGMKRATERTIRLATARARTAAYFQSNQEAFTTRTARFIIQDRFPNPVPNTPGGPLYGVEFSSLRGSDVLSDAQTPAISGDPGGIPLYVNKLPAGGIGVAGDGRDVCARQDFVGTDLCPRKNNRKGVFYVDHEEKDLDEAVALAGAVGHMAPESIRATQIFLDGLRLPFTADSPAEARPRRPLDDIIADGDGSLRASAFLGKDADIDPAPPETHAKATFGGIDGRVMNAIVASNDDPGNPAENLTARDVEKIFNNAVKQANRIRAAIRLPIGTPAIVHIAVTDRDGDIVGVFRMNDGTRFSYDVAVQKARTAAFFSDDDHAISTRAIGFLAQGFFPPGIDDARPGPLFGLQNELVLTPGNLKKPLANGITIFPGGIPLYKNGVLVGGVGISGDGVDQDDLIAYAGSRGFRTSRPIRSDQLGERDLAAHLRSRIADLAGIFSVSTILIDRIDDDLADGIDGVRLPYVKFPRNPNT